MKEIVIGILASMFFALTFILNRSMELSGGSWLWSSSMRFFFMVPFLLLIVVLRRNLKEVLVEMARYPLKWFCWSVVGFVLFYGPITFAAAFGPGWIVAGTWQLTIIAGILLAPFFYHTRESEAGIMTVRQKIPYKALGLSMVIFIGVIMIQWEKAQSISLSAFMYGVVPVILAAFAYPLGNRKMMELCGGRLDTFQRILGMTIATLPVWLIVALIGMVKVGPPSSSQVLQTFIVAVCSGVIATTLFFFATDRVRDNQGKLASVEATQSTQVIFVLIGEVILLSSPLPSPIATVGLAIIIVGMVLYSTLSKRL